jgi:hypothetical protein
VKAITYIKRESKRFHEQHRCMAHGTDKRFEERENCGDFE